MASSQYHITSSFLKEFLQKGSIKECQESQLLRMIADIRGDHIPPLLKSPILIAPNGVPRYWPAIWTVVETADLADSTRRRKLADIEDLYLYADHLIGRGAFDRALHEIDVEAIERVLQSWFVSIRNKPRITETDQAKWRTGFSFVTSVVNWVAGSDASTKEPLQRVRRRLAYLKSLYSQLQVTRIRKRSPIRSLPASVVTELYTLFDPGSAQNPFQHEQIRWRNYVLFLLCFHQGLRRGEALLLPADAVKSGVDEASESRRYWLNIIENDYEIRGDARFSTPSIKTHASRRQIPMTGFTARVIETYAVNFRGRPSHSFLFNSHRGRPLSTEAVTRVFDKASSALSRESKRVLEDKSQKQKVTPHDLRHTCAVVRLNQILGEGVEMDLALQKLRAFFGWSRTSKMPQRYAHAVFVDRLSTVWGEKFDDHVEIMRNLGGEL